MKKTNLLLALATTLVATSCSQDVIQETTIPDSEKTPIEFSMSDAGGAPVTRAGFTASKTKIVARFVSTDNTNTRYTLTTLKAAADAQASAKKYWTTSDVTYYADNKSDDRYWDDAFGRKANISVYAIAVPDIDDRADGYPTLYSLFADAGTVVGTTPWKTGSDNQQVAWSVNKDAQTTTTIIQEDLAYSNNIRTGGEKGVYRYSFTEPVGYPVYATEESTDNWTINTTDGPLTFKMASGAPEGSPGKFDKGHLNFKHALSRLTINLYAGKGFNMDLSPQPFDFKSDTNVDLVAMPQSGKFDIAAGDWVATPTTANIEKLASTTKATDVLESNKSTKPVYTLSAQVLPGYVFNSTATSTNVMHFNIDNNDYYITSAQIYEALKANAGTDAGKNGLNASASSYTMEQGKNYMLNITVNKTEISNVTATLVDWVEIAGSHTATNGYITLNLLDAGSSNTTACSNFDFYRALNTSSTLSTPTSPNFTGTSNNTTGYVTSEGHLSTETSGDFTHAGTKWNSKWFFNNNYSFYHFRTVMPGTAVTTDATNGDYFKMFSGPVNDTWTSSTATPVSTQANDGKFNDYHWGATYENITTPTGYLNYNNGFSHLSGPIGPYKNTKPTTDPTLNIIEQHMMANIKIIVETPKSGDTDYDARVQLYNSSNSDDRKGSVITLTNLYPEATVRMGNGKIEPGGTLGNSTVTHPAWSTSTDYFKTADVESNAYTYRVIPQELVRTSGTETKVGIIIQTPDDNMYYVIEDLSRITVKNAPSGHPMKGDHSKDAQITRWYPGYTYTYTFKLKKTGIENITCTIVDWVNVEAANKDITLEN